MRPSTVASSSQSDIEKFGLPWFALNVKCRHEKVVASFLENRGHEWFLPVYKSRRCWSDRVKELDMPLFPGYLFCRFDMLNRLPVLMIPGVLSIVGGTKQPTPIDPAEISSLQTADQAGLSRVPWPFLRTGDRLKIAYGSLAGVEGILLKVKGRHRLVLSVTLLQRSVAVDIEDSWVTPSAPRIPVRQATLSATAIAEETTA